MDAILERLDVGTLLTQVVAWLPQLGAGLLILVAFLIGSRLIRKPLGSTLRHTGLHAALVDLLVDKIFHYALITIGMIMALDQLGVNVAAALAGLGVAGIAVGFAAQDTLSNIISGIVIFLDKPFLVDDWVTTGDHYGKVSNITLRTTRIRTNRNTYVVIPNRHIIDSVLENHSKHGELRIDVPVGIAYKEDIAQARKVILAAVEKVEGLSERKNSDVVVAELGDSSVNLLVRVWIEDGKKERPMYYHILETTKNALDEADIEIPFPHLQLFVDGVKEPIWEQLRKLPGSS